MNTSIVDAFAVLKARAEAAITGIPIWWPDGGNILPDEPATFVFFELLNERGAFIEIGGGRGANRFSNSGELNGYVFVPKETGLAGSLALAEPIAAAFRSYRAGGVSCEGATVHPVGEGEALNPPGVQNGIAGNYTCVMVNIPLHFDQVG